MLDSNKQKLLAFRLMGMHEQEQSWNMNLNSTSEMQPVGSVPG